MNLPNKISLFRIALVPIIILIFIFPYGQFNIEVIEYQFENIRLSMINIVVLALFIIASLSDMVDGYIARKYNLVTSFGKFIDPIADKLLVNSLFIILAVSNAIPVVPVLIMIWRDVLVDGLRMSASSKGKVIAAGLLGKLKTVVQMITIIVLLLNNLPFELYRIPVGMFLLWLSAFISLFSGIVYFVQLKDVVLESK